jgi:hypothetical protein
MADLRDTKRAAQVRDDLERGHIGPLIGEEETVWRQRAGHRARLPELGAHRAASASRIAPRTAAFASARLPRRIKPAAFG